MAALHFDFEAASQSSDDTFAFEGGQRPSNLFNESKTNTKILYNYLDRLKDLQTSGSKVLASLQDAPFKGQALPAQIDNLVRSRMNVLTELNQNMASQMKSPYIECFFDIMSRRDSEGKVTGLSQYFYKLNVFDQVTILMRYYSIEEALEQL